MFFLMTITQLGRRKDLLLEWDHYGQIFYGHSLFVESHESKWLISLHTEFSLCRRNVKSLMVDTESTAVGELCYGGNWTIDS
jgi:hypothetical protein